ncbi:MAG: glycosyltransferase [Erysipelotrichaceae bacterium]|nr:glycosyltransferase [Erysipelotrichaceae bacterium]
MIWISIVIPVYNFGKYINKTLNSVINQPIFNLCEIRIINDGSTDNTKKVCMSYVNKYDNIYLHNQTNQGVSVARNVGIDQSLGKYILFLDADDTIIENFLSYDLIDILKGNYDVIMFNYIISNIDRDRYAIQSHYNDSEFVGGRPIYISGHFGSGLYNRNMLIQNDIYFKDGIKISEDQIFSMQAMYTAKKIKTSHIFSYIYNKNINSVSSSFNIDKKYHMVLAWQYLYEWAQENCVENKQQMLDYILFKLNSRIMLYAVQYAGICYSKKQLINELKRKDIYDIVNNLKPNEVLSYLIDDVNRYHEDISKFILHAKFEHWKVKYGRIALRIPFIRHWRDKKLYPYTKISKYGPINRD